MNIQDATLTERAKSAMIANGIVTTEMLMALPESKFMQRSKAFSPYVRKELLTFIKVLKSNTDEKQKSYADEIALYRFGHTGGHFFFWNGETLAQSAVLEMALLRNYSKIYHFQRNGISDILTFMEMPAVMAHHFVFRSEQLYRDIILSCGVYIPDGNDWVIDASNEIVDFLQPHNNKTEKPKVLLVVASFFAKAAFDGKGKEDALSDDELMMSMAMQSDVNLLFSERIQDFMNREGSIGSIEELRNGICELFPMQAYLNTIREDDRIVCADDGVISFKYQTAIDFAKGIKHKQAREVIMRRLHGEKTETIAASYGCTRAWLHRCYGPILLSRPLLKEDILYAYFFQTYKFVPPESFRITFGLEDDTSYWYLRMAYHLGEKPLGELLENELLSAEENKRLAEFLSSKWKRKPIEIDGEFKPYSVTKTLIGILRDKYKCEPVDANVLSRELYQLVTGCERETQEKADIVRERRNCLSTIGNTHGVVKHDNNMYRYLHIEEAQARELIDALPFSDFMDKRISASILWERQRKLMKKLDIRTPYELYSVLRDFEHLLPAYVTLIKTPSMNIGDVDFEKQVEECAIQNGVYNKLQNTARIMQEKYGFSASSLCGDPKFTKPMKAAKEKCATAHRKSAILC